MRWSRSSLLSLVSSLALPAHINDALVAQEHSRQRISGLDHTRAEALQGLCHPDRRRDGRGLDEGCDCLRTLEDASDGSLLTILDCL